MDVHKAVKVCEERHVTVEGSESLYISFDTVDDPWLSQLFVSFFEDGVIFLRLWLNFAHVRLAEVLEHNTEKFYCETVDKGQLLLPRQGAAHCLSHIQQQKYVM